jgi:hypothetical protein
MFTLILISTYKMLYTLNRLMVPKVETVASSKTKNFKFVGLKK